MDLFAHLDAARDQASAILASRDQANRDLTDAYAHIARLESENVELREQIPAPEPTPTPFHVGASVKRRDGETWAEALARFETSIGARVQCVRRFSSGLPTVDHPNWADVIQSDYPALVLSWKDGTRSQIIDFLDDLPAVDGRIYYVAHYHEPDKRLRMSGAEHRALSAELLAACDVVNRPDVVPTFVLTSWLERDPDGVVSSAAYFPDELPRWCMALDPYLHDESRTYATQVGKTVALYRAGGGHRIGIAEFGVKTTGAEAAEQITRFVADARADGCEFACYFDSDQGDNAGAGWYLDLRGAEALSAYGRLLT